MISQCNVYLTKLRDDLRGCQKYQKKLFVFIFFTASIAKNGEYVAPIIGRPKTVNDDVLIKTIHTGELKS